ncbi:hypothetical protein ACLOJK_023360 [Asimina triloba]
MSSSRSRLSTACHSSSSPLALTLALPLSLLYPMASTIPFLTSRACACYHRSPLPSLTHWSPLHLPFSTLSNAPSLHLPSLYDLPFSASSLHYIFPSDDEILSRSTTSSDEILSRSTVSPFSDKIHSRSMVFPSSNDLLFRSMVAGDDLLSIVDEMNIVESRIVPLENHEDYALALQCGPRRSGVTSIVDELLYIELFLSSTMDYGAPPEHQIRCSITFVKASSHGCRRRAPLAKNGRPIRPGTNDKG